LASKTGRAAQEYRAPLFLAWQLTNRCRARCLACCEESGPGNAWLDELSRDEALEIAHRIVDAGIPYVAFGGGEPMGVPHFREVIDVLAAGGVALKIETEGSHIDDACADHLAKLGVECVQISVDGPDASTHERARPGSSFLRATAAISRLVSRGIAPQLVFVPTRSNIREMRATYELAVALGCSAFVTGPLMRIGRAAAQWQQLACTAAQWDAAIVQLREHAHAREAPIALSIYPWDIVRELEERLASPQAMLLVVPNGKVKLLNALPFAAASLRYHGIDEAWQAYCDAWRSPRVRTFVERCLVDPALLRHANETWDVELAAQRLARAS
jgi:MoaA/NifB/PqqE/SkfB family radical SAM enzyme